MSVSCLELWSGAETEFGPLFTEPGWRSGGSPRAARPGYAYAPGGDPLHPLRGLPRPFGAPGLPGGLGRGHRAPPRGVDVKATPARTSREAPEGPKTPENVKNQEKWLKWPFSAFFAILGLLGPFLTIPDIPGRGVLHQPLAPGPCPGFLGVFWSGARGGPGRPKMGLNGENPRFRGFWGTGPRRGSQTGPAGDRAPARGVDVKPPTPGPLSGSTPGSRALGGAISPDPVPGACRGPFWPS